MTIASPGLSLRIESDGRQQRLSRPTSHTKKLTTAPCGSLPVTTHLRRLVSEIKRKKCSSATSKRRRALFTPYPLARKRSYDRFYRLGGGALRFLSARRRSPAFKISAPTALIPSSIYSGGTSSARRVASSCSIRRCALSAAWSAASACDGQRQRRKASIAAAIGNVSASRRASPSLSRSRSRSGLLLVAPALASLSN